VTVTDLAAWSTPRVDVELDRALVAEQLGMAPVAVDFFLHRAEHREVVAGGGEQRTDGEEMAAVIEFASK
jgi:hypothetical protein